MRNKQLRLLAISFSLIMIIAFPAITLAQTDISGTFKTNVIWDQDAEKLMDDEILNLVLERDFGLDANLNLDLQFNSYRRDQRISVNEKGEPVIEDMAQSERELDLELSEAYLNYYTDNMDWTLGKQVINWGSSFELQPTNYFNPQDFNALDPIDAKVGVTAINGTYYAPENIQVTGILTPFFEAHQMREIDEIKQQIAFAENGKGQMGQAIYNQLEELSLESFNQNINSNDITQSLAVDSGLEEVEDKLENIQGGIKITKRRWGRVDVSASAYRGRDKMPVLNVEEFSGEVAELIKSYGMYLQQYTAGPAATQQPMNFVEWYQDDSGDRVASPEKEVKYLYPQATRLGLDIIGDFNQFGGWLELAYSIYDQDQFASRLEATIGLDRRFSNGLYLVGQYYHRQGRLEAEDNLNLAMVNLDKTILDFHNIQLTTMYEFESDSYMAEVKFDYSLTDTVTWQSGLTYSKVGSAQGGLLATMGSDRIYTGIQVDF